MVANQALSGFRRKVYTTTNNNNKKKNNNNYYYYYYYYYSSSSVVKCVFPEEGIRTGFRPISCPLSLPRK